MGETTILKPIRFLSSNKTKSEMMQTFSLNSQEVEQTIITIKSWLAHKEEKREPKTPEPKAEDPPELKEKAEAILKDPDIIENFLTHQSRALIV